MLSLLSQRIKRMSVLRRLTFAAANSPPSAPHSFEAVADFANAGPFGSEISPDESRIYIENMRSLDPAAFASDSELLLEFCRIPRGPHSVTGLVLMSPYDKCNVCASTLYVRPDRYSKLVVFDELLGTLQATHYTKYCRKKGCSYQQHYGYHSVGSGSEVFYERNCLELKYFVSSRETAFSTEMLKKLDVEILIGQMSYKQKVDIYNYYHGYESANVEGRVRLDRRGLEVAHMRRAMVMVTTWYADIDLTRIRFLPSLDDTISQLNSQYHYLFHQLYAKHRCSEHGCGKVLVIDGNMKIHRNVCAAKDAGFSEYDGLPGRVKTGCMNTPEQQGVFCTIHSPRGVSGTSDSPAVCRMITAHRVTRTGTLYEVALLGQADSSSIWLPAEKIPPTVIQEYRNDVMPSIEDGVTLHSGQHLHTLRSTSNSIPSQDNQSYIVDSSDGTFAEHPDDNKGLVCNTEKDKGVRLHHRSAGILAGMWPCGVITLIGELYVAEAKTQVYGFLHSIIHHNAQHLSSLECICYDDGCHLRRFARNPVRCDVTATSKTIANLEIVIDRLHFKGHTDNWCKRNCNPDSLPLLENVDTEICEQTFSWLSRYSRIMRHMNKERFLFYLLYLCDCHNRRKALSTISVT